MDIPLQIMLPPDAQLLQKTDQQLPEQYRYKIPFSTPAYFSNNTGSFLSQAVNGEDYWIELLSCQITVDAVIILQLLQPAVAFVFLLEGNPGEHCIGDTIIRAIKGMYAALYILRANIPCHYQQENIICSSCFPRTAI